MTNVRSADAEAQAPTAAIPARMINEVVYCERLMYLEWVQGEFDDNAFTVEGRFVHRRADEPARDVDDERLPTRSLWLTSEALGVTGKIDVLEEDEGKLRVVEYKRGKAPDVPDGAYLPERVQVCTHVLLLRDNGYSCDEAFLYFAASRRRVPVVIDDELIATTRGAIERARAVAARSTPPPPLVDSPKCNGCSLVEICLPDETNELRAHEHERPKGPVRRLHPARDDRVAVYVQEQGAKVGVDGERIVVRGETKTEARITNTSQLVVFGNAQVSTQALRALADRGIPIFYFGYGGWFKARVVGLDGKNIELRMAQHRAADDPTRCLALARSFVVTKIRNCRTMLRRNHQAPDAVVLGHLEQQARRAERAEVLPSLLGIEGTAARDYFGAFTGMLKGRLASSFDLEGRNRRPPRDPINALLSFAYGLLTKEVVLALTAAGLDPLLGFYHQPRFGRPALALDVMEEFRPLLADSAVLGVINTGSIRLEDFVRHPMGVALTPTGRRRMIAAFERRLDQEITHPTFGYSISYRRVLEVQARLLGRLLLGEIDQYPSFRTR